MGRTARFDQIYVTNMDADPLEQDVLTGVKSILTGEITADLIETTNLVISGDVTSSGDLQLSGTTNVYRLTATQVGIGNENPTRDFEVSDKFSIDLNRSDLVVIEGNVTTSNISSTRLIETDNQKFKVDANGSNILEINGNTHTTNLNVSDYLTVGTDTEVDQIAIFKNGNVIVENGIIKVTGNVDVDGNITVTRDLTFKFAENLIVSNAVIQLADGVPGGQYDSGLIMAEDPGVVSNIALGYSVANTEIIACRTFESAYTIGGAEIGQAITIDSANTVNLHVYGQLYTDSNVGVANISPTHTMCVGSNVFIEDTAANVIHCRSNIYTHGIRIGRGGILAGNGLLVMDPFSQTPAQINSNVKMNAFRTTGLGTSGVSNLDPQDTLSIGAKIFANLTDSNTLTILGNTVSTNMSSKTLTSDSSLLIHADNLGEDSTSNVLTLRSGPSTSNTSTIKLYGAKTSSTHQNIRMFTKNTERIRIENDGTVGIGTNAPTEKLTVSGNIYMMGSNSFISGNVWGSTGNTSMRVFSRPAAGQGEHKIESIVGSGKGIHVYTSTTPTMGTPKVSILESSKIGINTSSPVGRLHTSGGTVFINDQPQYRSSYDHSNASLVVTNTSPAVNATDMGKVMHLAREGTSTRDGVRTTFELGKHDNTAGKSKTKLSLSLSDDSYTDDNTVMTLISTGKVGIGHTQPSAYLEVKSEGIGSATTGGILVHNHESGDAILAAQTDLSGGNAFTSYMQTDGDVISGWSAGVTGANSDFRIAQDPNKVNNADTLSVFISGSDRKVGISTSSPREEFEVNGNVVVGNILKFAGLTGSEYGNTQFIERRYGLNYNKNELVIYKGNKGSGNEGKTRIRHIGAEHLFQTYDDATIDITDENGIIKLDETDTSIEIPMRVTASGAVIIGGNITTEPANSSNKLVVAGNIEFTGGGEFTLTGIEFSTLTPQNADSVNVIKNIQSPTTGIRPLTFVHQISEGDDFEIARFDKEGHFGLGTVSPDTNVHIYSDTTASTDVFKIESPSDSETPTNLKKAGMLIYTTDGFGGYIRGYRKESTGVAGLVLGSANNSILTDTIWIAESSNVGIGTSLPSTKLHLYDGISRIEHSSSNALVELKTSSGTSNVLSDTTGNVHIQPENTHTHFRGNVTVGSNLTVTNDLSISGKISIGDTSSGASLQVGGGLVVNTDEVSCKKYSKKFTRSLVQAKDIQLYFGKGAFYAKVVAMLRRTNNGAVADMSTMVLELQGGTEDKSLSTVDIAIGTKNIFGGTNNYPWSPQVSVGKRGVIIRPYNTTSTVFSYDIHVELISSKNGSLDAIYNNNSAADNTGGIELATFDY